MIEKIIHCIKLYSGVLGVLFLWTFILIGMYNTGLGLIDDRPISSLGVNHESRFLFTWGLIGSALLFTTFAYYIKDAFHTNQKFVVYFLIGQVGQVVAAIVPYGQNNPYRIIHTVAAFILAFSLPFLIYEFAKSQKRDRSKQIFTRSVYFELLLFSVGIGLFIFTSGIAPLGQALPAIGFHIWIFIVTYYALTDEQHPLK